MCHFRNAAEFEHSGARKCRYFVIGWGREGILPPNRKKHTREDQGSGTQVMCKGPGERKMQGDSGGGKRIGKNGVIRSEQ